MAVDGHKWCIQVLWMHIFLSFFIPSGPNRMKALLFDNSIISRIAQGSRMDVFIVGAAIVPPWLRYFLKYNPKRNGCKRSQLSKVIILFGTQLAYVSCITI